jgi:hypothetical protein
MPDIVLPPLINGHRFGFSSIECFVAVGVLPRQLYLDIVDITYGESLEFEFKQGTARVPLGSTPGNWVAQECSFKMGKSTFQYQLVQAFGPGWLGANIRLDVAYADIGEPPVIDSIVARIVGANDAHSYGNEPLETEVKCKLIQPITRNGIGSMLNRVV